MTPLTFKDLNRYTKLTHETNETKLGLLENYLVRCLKSGTSINCPQDEHNNTALHLAVITKANDIVIILLRHQADFLNKNKAGHTPIELCLRPSHSDILPLFTNIFQVVRIGNENLFEFALKHNGKGCLSQREDGKTPFMAAAEAGQTGLLCKIAALNGDFERSDCDGEGRTALHFAAQEGHEQTVAVLLQKGSTQRGDGDRFLRTPLHLAAEMNRVSVIRLLASEGSLYATNKSGKRPVDIARAMGHKEVAQILIPLTR